MWYLTSENDNRVIYVISTANQVVIGRSIDNQVCNFAIPDDPSISRKHAILAINDNILYLQDLGSRYGTFVNTEQVEVNNNVKLNENDVVKFGKMNSIWNVKTANFITCTSTLKGENLQNLKQVLSKIDGLLKGDWDDTCKFLTMPAITLTIKVVLALVQGSHIVTTEFWLKCLESVTNSGALPDPNDFIPQVVESTLNKEVVSFLPDSRRSNLFQGKKFVFFSRRQYEMYKTVLLKSGGTPMLLSECRMTISMLCGPDVVVIQYIGNVSQETQTQRNQVADIVNQLKNKGKRVVADAEIGLAILYCSLNKYCNPNFSFTSEVVKQTSAPNNNAKVLAQESQEPASQQSKDNVKINETLNSEDNNDKVSIKRKLSEITNEVEGNPNKKLAANTYTANVKTESTKRRLSGDANESLKPTKRQAISKDEQNSNDSSTNPLEQGDNENSNDIFNFIKPICTNNSTESKGKKLNLTRPQKRRLNDNDEDGNLFNFIQRKDENKSEANTSKQSLFSIDENNKNSAENTDVHVAKKETVTTTEISAMRGSKLKELMERNLSCDYSTMPNNVKKENEDLESKMEKLDLCNTIVTTCNLIVKREPYKIENDSTSVLNSTVKNFKKFKKVWPVKRHSSVLLSSSSMSFSNNTPQITAA